MIVADANVVAYLILQGQQTEWAQAVLRMDPEWRLPPLWRHELLNVLATFVRHEGADVEAVLAKWDEALQRFSPFEQEADPRLALLRHPPRVTSPPGNVTAARLTPSPAPA